MKRFKEFLHQSQDIPVFCNAGGSLEQYTPFHYNGSNPESRESVVFSNSGGPPKQYENIDFFGKLIIEYDSQYIDENLNPRKDPKIVNTNSKILYDPEKNNVGDNHPEDISMPDYHGTGFVNPHYTNEQSQHVKSLLHNTIDSDDYHRIIEPYTCNSFNLNNTLYKHGINGTQPPKKINANAGDSEIDIDEMDSLIREHRLPHAMSVYTGLHFSPRQHKGRIYIHHPYMSTSISPHVAKDFGKDYESNMEFSDNSPLIRNIMRLDLPSGHHHLATDSGSIFPGQGEVILPRGTRFQLGQKPTHIIHGNFNDHFRDEPSNNKRKVIYHLWRGRIL